MEDRLDDFIEEFELDKRFAIDPIDLFKDRISRRIKLLAIVDVEYFWEEPELLDKAKFECYEEIDKLIKYFLETERYEICEVLKHSKLSVEEVYKDILESKIKQCQD